MKKYALLISLVSFSLGVQAQSPEQQQARVKEKAPAKKEISAPIRDASAVEKNKSSDKNVSPQEGDRNKKYSSPAHKEPTHNTGR